MKRGSRKNDNSVADTGSQEKGCAGFRGIHTIIFSVDLGQFRVSFESFVKKYRGRQFNFCTDSEPHNKIFLSKHTRKKIYNKNLAETITCAFMCKNTGFFLHFGSHLCVANLKVKVTKYKMLSDRFEFSTHKLCKNKRKKIICSQMSMHSSMFHILVQAKYRHFQKKPAIFSHLKIYMPCTNLNTTQF